MIRKGRPWRPARCWEKSAGPRESTRTASATTSSSGLSTISPTAESPMSSTRFMAIVDHDVPQVPYSITGISAMWESRTAVPSIALMGGITLSLTPGHAADGDDAGQRGLVELGHGEHHALGA